MTFDRIIAPIERDRFLSQHWTRQGVHIPANGRTFGEVFGWDGLNAILNAHDLAFPQVKMSRSEDPVPVERFTTEVAGRRSVNTSKLLDLFREGASFGVTGADSHWPPLRAAIDAFYDVLLESIHTNVYCSPANTQGFQCHFDLHEVFVLQIEGEKHWKVFRPTTEAPIESWRAKDAPTSADPYVDVVLRKGDVLYVPRGHWHYAVAQGSTSLHVTVGVTCRKGAAFADWLTSQLAQHPEWRRNAPPIESGPFAVPPAFAEWIGGLKRLLASVLAEPGLDERFWKAMFDEVQPRPHMDLAVQAGLDELSLEGFVFERPAGRRHLLALNGDSLVVSAGGCDIELEAADRGLIEKMFEADSFTAEDLRKWQPGVNLEEVAELVRVLIRSGLLSVRPI